MPADTTGYPPEFAALLDIYNQEVTALMARLEAGKVTSAAWTEEMQRLLSRYSQAARMLGMGEVKLLPAEVDAVRAWLNEQFKYLDGFETVINSAGGEYDPAWLPRAQMYGASTVTEYWEGKTAGLPLPALSSFTIKTYEQFRTRLYNAAERLFTGGRDANFLANFARTIDQQLTEAWNVGAQEVGIDPDEMTANDFEILNAIINNENEFINRIADDIDTARKEGLEPEKFESKFGARINLWAQRYVETVNRAKMHFGSQQRFEWVLGKTKEHCSTCPRLAGIVAFGREWDQARVHPQMPPNPQLECHGWLCDCYFQPTTKRRTPRALDQIINIALEGHL